MMNQALRVTLTTATLSVLVLTALPAQAAATATERQQTVDALVALTRGREIPPQLLTGDAVSGEDVFDVNDVFTVLTHLSMEPGYVLDYVSQADSMGGHPVVYARPASAPSFASFDEYQSALAAETSGEAAGSPPVEHLQTDGTEDGFFELAVFLIMGEQFYLDWDTTHNDTTVVCDTQGWETALLVVDTSVQGIIMSVIEAIDISPQVVMDEETVDVRVVTFSKWGGFIDTIHTFRREFPHEVMGTESSVLAEYDCDTIL
ncbi:hypothetical protein JXA47_02975 [Candidatus Sumerlaeota bacterium]|nr:hypothetical protein [Candidatus Sumerlaeota bacterium]